MTSLRRALDAKKAGVDLNKPVEIPAGTSMLDAAAMLGWKVVAVHDGERTIAVDPMRQSEFDKHDDPGMWIEGEDWCRMFDAARREAADFARANKPKAAKVRKEPKSKDRMKSYTYRDPSD